MVVEITTLSSKGQIVIPAEIRAKLNLTDGESLVISARDNIIVMKKIEDPMEKEDLKTLAEIKEAWKEIAEGKFKKRTKEDFLNEISKW